MHRANFHNMAKLFTFENSITSTTGHASYIEQLCTIDHVVVCERKRKSQSKKKKDIPNQPFPIERTYLLVELHTLPLLLPDSRDSLHLPIKWLSLVALLPEEPLDRYHQRRTLVAEPRCCSHIRLEERRDCSLDNDQNNHRLHSGFEAYPATAATELASGHPLSLVGVPLGVK